MSTAWKQVSTTQLLDELNKKLNRSDVVQSVGGSKTQVMSQNAVTDALSAKQDKGDYATNSALNEVRGLANTANQNTANANNNANSRLAKAQNGLDIPDKAAFVRNLGLTVGSALPVGVPVPWPLETPPAGWLKCDGSTFGAGQYPELAKAYPSLRLPDLRGEFIRGWDDGRRIDQERVLLSWQADSFLAHQHGITTFDVWDSTVLIPNDRIGDEILSTDNAIKYGNNQNGKINNKYETRSGGGNETRPRNIAFNYIVRAV